MHASLPHVVSVGGGFGGLSAARALVDKTVRVTLLDRRNHHLFQPLLYQVATVGLVHVTWHRGARLITGRWNVGARSAVRR